MNLFIYGTLTHPYVQQKVIGRVVDMRKDSLLSYEKAEVDIDGTIYPTAIPKDTAMIDGFVIEVTDEEIEKIDKYETTAYVRKDVELVSGTRACTYCMPANVEQDS